MKAFRARHVITLAEEKPARGRELFKPLSALDDGIIVIAKDKIEAVGPFRSTRLPVDCPVEDLGEVTIIPAPVNAHCHLRLSHLAGKTLRGRGFAAWLKSLIPLILAEKDLSPDAPERHAIATACAAACRDAAQGACHVGDIGGSLPGSLGLVAECARKANLGLSQFCECFGFEPANSPWPEASRPELTENCAPAGHALYSTAPETLVAARNFCRENGLTFSMHLAESPEETEQLLEGSGPLYELYRGKVLPKNWRPPRMRPAEFAASLGLFGPGFLAVHGVWLNDREMRALARSGSALCLCPRSNRNLAVGRADIAGLVESGVLLCLGTDGLTSNTDVNVLNEARFLLDVLPEDALLRMLTINGAAALGLARAGRLAPGAPAAFRVWAGL